MIVHHAGMVWHIENGQEPALQELIHGPDRVCAIMAGALLDSRLEQLLATALPALPNRKAIFANGGVLYDFKPKIEMAYAFGLVGPAAYNDLDIIRDVRNKFAHRMFEMSFNDDFGRDKCANLKLPESADALGHHGWAKTLQSGSNSKPVSRLRFECAVSIISGALLFGELRVQNALSRSAICLLP